MQRVSSDRVGSLSLVAAGFLLIGLLAASMPVAMFYGTAARIYKLD